MSISNVQFYILFWISTSNFTSQGVSRMMLPIQIDTDETQGKNIQVAQEYADIHAFMKVRCQSWVIHFRLSEQHIQYIKSVPYCASYSYIEYQLQSSCHLPRKGNRGVSNLSRISHSSEIGMKNT